MLIIKQAAIFEGLFPNATQKATLLPQPSKWPCIFSISKKVKQTYRLYDRTDWLTPIDKEYVEKGKNQTIATVSLFTRT